MELTQNFVKAKRPCADGYRWYIRNRHNGTDYQHVLDSLVREGRVTDAIWLVDSFGPTDAVLEADAIEADALVFAGTSGARQSVGVHGVWQSLARRCPSGYVEVRDKHLRYLGERVDDVALLEDLHTRRVLLEAGWSLAELAAATKITV